MDLQELKDFLRVDTNCDDKQIESMKLAAEIYLKNSGSQVYAYDNELYKLAIKMLVSHWYDNRQIVEINETSPLFYSLRHIMMQLKYCY